MSGIFNSIIFNNTIFNTGTSGGTVVVDVTKTGAGGIEGGGVYKPTGYVKRKKLKLKKHEERIEEFQDAQIEIAARLAQEFTTDVPRGTFEPISQMSMLDVEREIGQLLRKKIETEDEELFMLLIAAAG
jgi:hypothetical protein